MKKIVGGLLVATLLTNPSILKSDLLAYKVLQAEKVIISGMRREEEYEITSSDVDELLEDIDKNSRKITTLLKDKYNIIGKIQSMMNLKAYTKSVMNDYQINIYQEFNNYYKTESKNLSDTLETIESEKMDTAKKELLKNASDYSTIYTELKEINNHQYDAIYNLNGIIQKGSMALSMI